MTEQFDLYINKNHVGKTVKVHLPEVEVKQLFKFNFLGITFSATKNKHKPFPFADITVPYSSDTKAFRRANGRVHSLILKNSVETHTLFGKLIWWNQWEESSVLIEMDVTEYTRHIGGIEIFQIKARNLSF
tara:strand:- start:351 stop:743 length:393 start_codon:yes stop_codon:yes gene_type:complete